MDNAETISASLSMTREAKLKWLMQHYGEKVFHLICLTVKNPSLAEDITQDVFIKAYRSLDAFRGDGDIKHWLYKIAMNEARKHFRTWSFRHIFPTVDDQLGSMLDVLAKNHVEAEMESRVEREAMIELVSSLLPKYRQVVILHYYEDLSVKEVAEILSVTQEVVRTRLHRARKQLRALMSREGER